MHILADVQTDQRITGIQPMSWQHPRIIFHCCTVRGVVIQDKKTTAITKRAYPDGSNWAGDGYRGNARAAIKRRFFNGRHRISVVAVRHAFGDVESTRGGGAVSVTCHGHGSAVLVHGVVQVALSEVEGQSIRRPHRTQQQDEQDGASRPFQL